MILRDQHSGKDTLFDGDRTLLLRSIPSGAKIVSARVSVTPVDNSGLPGPSEDSIQFQGLVGRVDEQEERLATKTQVLNRWVEVDFHGRRTLVSVDGSTLVGTTLQVDVGGGTFIEINNNGAFKAPEDEGPFIILSDLLASLPGLTVTGFKLTNPDDVLSDPDITTVTIRNVASNVSLRLGELPPFWIHLGEMIDSETTPDFAELLQSVLADSKIVNGFYVVPLILHSDSLARLDVEVEIEFQRQVNVLPQGLNEVVVLYDFNGPPKAKPDLLAVSLPVNARVVPGKTGGRVIGAFEETRIIHGPIGDVGSKVSIDISPAVAQARLATFDSPVTASAIDFLVAPVDEVVRLQLDLREDLDGKPDNISLLSTPIEFGLDRKKTPGPNWMNVPLPQGFRFEDLVRSQRLWMIIQSLNGRAEWSAAPVSGDEIGMQHTRDGGLSWRETLVAGNTVNAHFRLRNTPDRFQVPIQLRVGSGDQTRTVSLDRFQPMGRVDFALDFDEVADALNGYLDATAPKRCPEVEHLANGDFDLAIKPPPHLSLPLVPADWILTLGKVELLRGSGDDNMTYIQLGENDSDVSTGLSQVTPIMGGCKYLFEFTGLARQEGAVAEVIWLSEDCGAVRIDSLEFPLETVGVSQGFNHVDSVSAAQTDGLLSPFRSANLVAPPEAVQAEIRFLVPEGVAHVDKVSLKATTQGVVNADLRDIRDQTKPEGWTVSPQGLPLSYSLQFELETVSVLVENPSQNGVIAELSQRIPLFSDQPFIFEFNGRVIAPVGPALPDVLLRWIKADGTSLEPIQVGPVSPTDLDRHVLEGKVPTGASQLEIRIILPPGPALVVDHVSFRQIETINVPLNFVSHAPGELTVSDLQVAYEFVDPLPPSIPESGLCFATPPDREPGEICEDKCFCSVCKKDQPMTKVKLAQTSSGRPAIVGECRTCGSRLIRLGGEHDPQAPTIPSRRISSTTLKRSQITPRSSLESSESPTGAPTPTVRLAPSLHPKQLSLTDVKGIGESRARVLSQHGMDSLQKLAIADAQNLAKMLRVAEDMAAQIIDRAQQLLASSTTNRHNDSVR